MREEDLYELANEELNSRNRKADLWARACALATDDVDEARYLYTNLRVEELALEHDIDLTLANQLPPEELAGLELPTPGDLDNAASGETSDEASITTPGLSAADLTLSGRIPDSDDESNLTPAQFALKRVSEGMGDGAVSPVLPGDLTRNLGSDVDNTIQINADIPAELLASEKTNADASSSTENEAIGKGADSADQVKAPSLEDIPAVEFNLEPDSANESSPGPATLAASNSDETTSDLATNIQEEALSETAYDSIDGEENATAGLSTGLSAGDDLLADLLKHDIPETRQSDAASDDDNESSLTDLSPADITTEPADALNAELPKPITADAPESITAEVPESITAEVPESITADVPEPITAEVSESITDDAVEPALADPQWPESSTFDEAVTSTDFDIDEQHDLQQSTGITGAATGGFAAATAAVGATAAAASANNTSRENIETARNTDITEDATVDADDIRESQIAALEKDSANDREYAIYQHANGVVNAVPKGGNWKAMLLTLPWLLSKRLWGHSLVYLLLWLVLAAALLFFGSLVIRQWPNVETIDLAVTGGFALLAIIGLFFLPFRYANRWQERKVSKAGFSYMADRYASTVTAAEQSFLLDKANPVIQANETFAKAA